VCTYFNLLLCTNYLLCSLQPVQYLHIRRYCIHCTRQVQQMMKDSFDSKH
jgi:hypothetical protein